MMDKSELILSLEFQACDEELNVVRQGLQRFNNRFIKDDGFKPLTIFLRREDGSIVGGLLGDIYWGWLYISILWLEEEYRGGGYGSRLLEMAEEEALRQGCAAIHLDTMSFQAQPFYEKHGYQVFGQLDDLPVGHQRIFMWKKLLQTTSHQT
jgi:GNAT superfamily N-acetyltransferase